MQTLKNLLRASSCTSCLRGSILALAATCALPGCGGHTLRIDIVPTEDNLEATTIETAGTDAFTSDKIAMITVSGLIANARSSSLLSNKPNPVSDFREALDA